MAKKRVLTDPRDSELDSDELSESEFELSSSESDSPSETSVGPGVIGGGRGVAGSYKRNNNYSNCN